MHARQYIILALPGTVGARAARLRSTFCEKAPGTKIQAPIPQRRDQSPNQKQHGQLVFGGFDLEFLWMLELGFWSFGNEF
jgi:hypothetical protein